MSFFRAYGAFWQNYTNFKGRSSRSEFWWVQLWHIIIFLIIAIGPIIQAVNPQQTANLGVILIGTLLYFFYGLIIIIPSLSLGIRRFHDVNVSAWWYAGLVIIPSVVEEISRQMTNGTGLVYYTLLAITLILALISVVITLLPAKEPNRFGTASKS